MMTDYCQTLKRETEVNQKKRKRSPLHRFFEDKIARYDGKKEYCFDHTYDRKKIKLRFFPKFLSLIYFDWDTIFNKDAKYVGGPINTQATKEKRKFWKFDDLFFNIVCLQFDTLDPEMLQLL